MYWRFGHQNASVIDHLLESGNVSLEELLEQDDLIQECKAQNPRLIEYLRDPTVLQQLLSYITSDELEDRARFKYPFIACEVIACEVWGIFESALSNIDMLVMFWEFLDRPPPLNPVQASYFAKVIGVFLMKKTSEMMHFIRSQPEVVPKLLLHMSTSSIMDLLLKIISMEESPEGKGTVQWLSEQGLMPWLVNRLDPNFDAEVHSIASQVLLDIIAISQSSHPEQPSIGTNMLIEELKSEVIVSQLVTFMLDRDAPYSSSTLINGVTIFIELIRRNNSDYDVEPLPPNAEPPREPVDLSDLLKVLASRIEDFKDLLIEPRSVTGPIETSIGRQVPLGFERLKICEMFAELLHCSNMAVLNSRPIITISPDGTVRIPTVSLDCAFSQHHHQLSRATSASTVLNANGAAAKEETSGSPKSGLESAQDDKKVTKKAGSTTTSKSDEKENGDVNPKGPSKDNTTLLVDDQITPKASPSLGPVSSVSILTSATIVALASANVMEGDVLIPVGDFLKLQFVEHRIIPTCFDLFFQFPWNNFLHTVVYDMVHQVFHRPMGDIGRQDVDGTYIPPKANQDLTEGWNRRLTISIFKDGQLTKRITDAQRLCDYECALPKGVRLGYMGHLTYIADETVKLLELYQQTSLLSTLYESIDLEDWWNYVSKVLKETKERDAQVLGGTRPNVVESHRAGHDDPNDDDYLDDNDDDYGGGDFLGGENGTGLEGDVASDQFARYLCQQITNNLPDKFGSSDEDEDDEEYGAESKFDGAGAPDSLDDPFGDNSPMDFDSDDDEGVDEETWNVPWPSTFSENKPADSGSSTQFSATLTDYSEGSQGMQVDEEIKETKDPQQTQETQEIKETKEAKESVGASESTSEPTTRLISDVDAKKDKANTVEQTTASATAAVAAATLPVAASPSHSINEPAVEKVAGGANDSNMDTSKTGKTTVPSLTPSSSTTPTTTTATPATSAVPSTSVAAASASSATATSSAPATAASSTPATAHAPPVASSSSPLSSSVSSEAKSANSTSGVTSSSQSSATVPSSSPVKTEVALPSPPPAKTETAVPQQPIKAEAEAARTSSTTTAAPLTATTVSAQDKSSDRNGNGDKSNSDKSSNKNATSTSSTPSSTASKP
ncbi:hypothetical protein BGZ68_005070 [Mortierella alpina]|nr:hypothetical protein BGZ68_005070 [Mortierella alpina]